MGGQATWFPREVAEAVCRSASRPALIGAERNYERRSLAALTGGPKPKPAEAPRA